MLKTQALSVGPFPIIILYFLIHNARTDFLRSVKILGVTLDKDLSYKKHISMIEGDEDQRKQQRRSSNRWTGSRGRGQL